MNNSTVHGSATDGLTFEILSVAVSCDLFLNSFSIHAIFEGLLFPQKAFDPLQFNTMDFTSDNQQGLLVTQIAPQMYRCSSQQSDRQKSLDMA